LRDSFLKFQFATQQAIVQLQPPVRQFRQPITNQGSVLRAKSDNLTPVSKKMILAQSTQSIIRLSAG